MLVAWFPVGPPSRKHQFLQPRKNDVSKWGPISLTMKRNGIVSSQMLPRSLEMSCLIPQKINYVVARITRLEYEPPNQML